jgi:2-methylcitrate dehydratase PrpD
MIEADGQITTHLSRYAAHAADADLPLPVRTEARRALFNIVGCAIGGARHGSVQSAHAAFQFCAGPPQATLLGRGERADLLHAVLLNCLAASAYSFDDTHEQAVVHPGGPAAAAALAVAERIPTTGRALLSAFALGVEFTCRLSKAISVTPASGDVAWSQTGITGGIGAAVAAGRLLGLDAASMQTAIGIALSQAAGFRVMHGSFVTALMPAHAAQTGVRAALLAERGFTASAPALEGRYGFLSVFAKSWNADALSGGLGQRFELMRNTYKPYPCGIVIHPIIDACLQLRREHGADPTSIEHVAIRASPGAMALCNRRNPIDEMQAHVSLHHWTAIAFLRGTARIQDMDTATAVRDPAVIAFQDKVEATEDRTIAADAAEVTIAMTDGLRHTVRIEHCLGSASRPMTDAELTDKFRGLAEPVLGSGRAATLIPLLWEVDELPDAAAIPRAAA